ncbi:predicted protein [Uncinocarpus reesii 1704]|uniref:Regulator of volume decrease after cellular swelling-domain-containing protein n=1 Tax=Uncinocarpus reesii (strain UAMH 1704) TaxID=336963 RepID=C4JLR6_UNCRE|nr:uncharacterized protein UREG_03774 [Uncinocarpus reesii 1704]EEP78928.1 predicted protein [Uncinocarpus reesii 1704]
MEALHGPPNPSSFISLAEHQSHTPESFYSGPPILHHLSERCKIVILEGELASVSALSGLRPGVSQEATNGAQPSEGSSDQDKEIVIDGVDVWVTSEKLLLYNPSTTTGVAIPYRTISLHAIQRLRLPDSQERNDVQGLYMQLSIGVDAEEDLEEDAVSLTVVPPAPQPATTQAQSEGENESLLTDDKPSQTPTELLYAALSACSNLHPDPADEEDDLGGQPLADSALFQSGLVIPGNNAGGLPPAMPGSGGWITAENMHEFFDEEGNWIGEGRGPLGPGAGSVRPREEDDEGNQAGEDGSGAGAEETKWQRTG